MKENHSYYKYKIILAILGLLTLIATGLIKYHPWSNNNEGSIKNLKNENFLSGTVVDESTNYNISQAEITVVGRNEKYVTESNGNFRIPFKDSIGHVRIRIEKNGYITYDKSYDVPSPDIIIQLVHK